MDIKKVNKIRKPYASRFLKGAGELTSSPTSLKIPDINKNPPYSLKNDTHDYIENNLIK